jgi:GH24 family phage-related lysozyme (muramidase)
MPINQVQFTDERWLQFWDNYKGLKHQKEALIKLARHIKQADAGLLTESAEWVENWQGQVAPAPAFDWLTVAQPFVASFEGFRADAYLCPAGVWTVGYGATSIDGKAVKRGDKITQQAAAKLLGDDLKRFYDGLARVIPAVRMYSPNQQAALVSWAFNVGLGAVEESTLKRRLQAGENPLTVVAQELPRWNKGAGGQVLEGLARRRTAEVDLFRKGVAVPPAPAFTPASPFSHAITPNITYGEIALQSEPRRFHRQHQCDTAVLLCQFAQKARGHFKRPVIITSGYRPPKINAQVGGASRSEHLYDKPDTGAIDFYLDGMSVTELQRWADVNWPYSLGYGAPKGFIHIGIRSGRPRVRWDY